MTAIAYKDGVMAGDSASWQSDVLIGYHKKVFKSVDGWLVGCAGTLDCISIYREWFLSGAKGKAPRLDEMTALIVSPQGQVFCAVAARQMRRYKLARPLAGAAIGMGHQFIMGIMAQGGTAEEAVRLAVKHVAYVAGRVYTVSLDN